MGLRPEQTHLTEENIQMANKYMKICSKSNIFRELQIKTQSNLTPHTYQNSQNLKHWQHQILVRVWNNRNFHSKWWECKVLKPLGMTVWQWVENWKYSDHIHDWAIVFTSIYPNEQKAFYTKSFTWKFLAALFIFAKTWK